MKKIAMIMAAAVVAVSASAQKTTITGHKTGDNLYIGVNAGASTVSGINGCEAFKAWDPTLGIRLGKNFTTEFGVALDIETRFNGHKGICKFGTVGGSHYTAFNGLSATLLATGNLMNIFGSYKGEPRPFEIIALGGIGWGHAFPSDQDKVFGRLGADFAYNFGSDKEFQVYIEPSLDYDFASRRYGSTNLQWTGKFNASYAEFNLKAGFIYKFKCSNGRHNFAFEQVRDQAEIDGLNSKINSLRNDVDAANKAKAAADAKVAQLQSQIIALQKKSTNAVVEKKPTSLQPSVVFQYGKSKVQKSQMANVELIADYMKQNPNVKVKISGHASPEGSTEYNQKLSEKRAQAVKDILVNKYKISADRLETEGLGATDKLFDEVEFNRVSLFKDTTK